MLRRGKNPPKRIECIDRSELWIGSYSCHAFFAIERDFYGGPLRLTVGGASSEDCVRTWELLRGWVREMVEGMRER